MLSGYINECSPLHFCPDFFESWPLTILNGTYFLLHVLFYSIFLFFFSGKAHLREALLLHEEAMRVNRMCRELRKKDVLQDVLRLAHDRSLNKYASIDEEDDFQVS